MTSPYSSVALQPRPIARFRVLPHSGAWSTTLFAGPVGFQVGVVCGQPASRWPVADFVSLMPRKCSFVMHQLDTAPPHTRPDVNIIRIMRATGG